MKFETFKAGRWITRYQYKSFEPVPVDHDWTWENASINTLLESANRALGEQPIVSATDVERALAISTPTANKLIRDFERLGVLSESTGQARGRVYEFKRYLNLFLS